MNHESSESEVKAAKYFVILFALVLLMLLAGIASINYLVNPYGEYPTRLCRPMVQMSRIKKVEIVNSLELNVKGVVLGSSRVMQIQPADLEAITGIPFVNLGVNSGSTIDFLALTQLFEKKMGRLPECLVIGLDLESFSDSRAIDSRLMSQPDLMALVADRVSWSDRLHQFGNLLSANQFTTSVQCLVQNVTGRFPESKSVILENGTIEYLHHNKLLENGEIDLKSMLLQDKAKHLGRFVGFDRLSKERLAELRLLLESCAKSSIEVKIYLTPYHPNLIEELKDKTEFLLRAKELIEQLSLLTEGTDFEIFDFSEIENFSGDPENFKDNVHCLSQNSKLILREIFGHKANTSSARKLLKANN